MVLSGIVMVAGSVCVMMGAGSGVVAALKFFHEWEPTFGKTGRGSRDLSSNGYSPREAHRAHTDQLRRNNSTNVK